MPVATDRRSQTSPIWVKVDGTDLEPDVLARVAEVTIEQDLVLPDSFAVRLRDVDDRPGQQEQRRFHLLDTDQFPIGAAIEIGMGREAHPRRVLTGEITSLELETRGDGAPLITVRGYDGAHRLHRERKSRTFRNVSDSDLASTIARDYGLTPRTDPTDEVHEHVFQDNQTDWSFLRARANLVGFELFVLDGALHFRKPPPEQAPVEQELGQGLLRVKLRLSAPRQVDEVVVRGWDPAGKRAVTGRATRPTSRPRIGEQRGGAQLASRLGTGRFVLAEQPVRSQGEADALAQSLYDAIAGDFLHVEAVCLGDAQLRPGKTITLKNVSRRFDGDYYVSSVQHRATPAEGYLSHVTVGGRRPGGLAALLHGGATASPAGWAPEHSHPGVVVGLVTNNKDAERGGRVKVRFPWLAEDESHWARLSVPMAGDGRGFYFLPEVGDEVLVVFEHGDVNHPYVVGALWNGQERPPKGAGDVVGPTGKVNQRIIRSRLGHTITLDDSDEQPGISIVDRTGQNTITLDSTQNKLTISVQGEIAVQAQSKLSLQAATVDIQATGPLTIKGAVVNIN